MYEVDPRHVEIVVNQLKLQDAKEVNTPETREEGRTTTDNEMKFNENDSTQYRAIVARLNYLSPDRPDISYSVKELARAMSSPSNGDWLRLKRLGRYLKGRPRLQQVFEWQLAQRTISIYIDADWAGCKQIRKSTTGGCIMMGKHIVKSWSKTQSLVALSSGESELYAALKSVAETPGLMSMLKDLNWTTEGKVYGDASAALGIIHRIGLGKTRHIDTSLLWIQHTAAERHLTFTKVLGKNNPADIFTKYLDQNTSDAHLKTTNYYVIAGRATEAPKLHLVSQSWSTYIGQSQSQEWKWLKTIVGTGKSGRHKCGGELNAVTKIGRLTGSGP